jgi:hypothetical protein
MIFKRKLFGRKTVRSNEGGTTDNGPFCVQLQFLRLIYRERDRKLTIPVEPLLGPGAYCSIGTALIRRWDNSQDTFRPDQVFAIKQNIFAALDFMRVRYTNVR